MQTLFYFGLIFVIGVFTAWVSPKLKLPRVVGYLLIGLLIGPEILGIIPREFVDNSYIITDIALSIIAVLIGSTLKLSTLKKFAKEVINITLFQSVFTFIFVASGYIIVGSYYDFLYHDSVMIALLLGAIASATAPATPLAIVHELRSSGNFTSTLLAIVAADDALALIMFSLALTVGSTISGNSAFEWSNMINAVMVIFFSSIIGIIAALTNTMVERLLIHQKGMETIFTIGLIFIVYSLSEHWNLEPLLSAMVMGIVMVNTSDNFDLVEKEIDEHLIDIIFMLFFIISAMHLKISSMVILPFVIELYVILRFFGKVIGSYLGAIISGSSEIVRKYMGIALIPQAGVAIGLALSIQNHEGFENIGPIVLNIVITTTLIHELVGPFMTKYAIEKSGESNKSKI